MTEEGLVDFTQENIGYDYRDVIVPAVKPNFTYFATNPKTKYSIAS